MSYWGKNGGIEHVARESREQKSNFDIAGALNLCAEGTKNVAT
jgi:hypothetical protein